MKSLKSLLLVSALTLAVLAGCNITVNEAPEAAEPAEGQSSVSAGTGTPAEEAMEEASEETEEEAMEGEVSDEAEEEADIEEEAGAEAEEEGEGGSEGALELNMNLKPLEIAPVIIPDDPDPEIGDIKLEPKPVIIDLSQ